MLGTFRDRWILTLLVVLGSESWSCSLGPRTSLHAEPITYSRDVLPVLTAHCTPCHQPGQQAPFSVFDYQAVRTHATLIVQMTRTRLMPPWLPEPGYGHFIHQDERRLTDDQIRLVQRWVEQGALEGSSATRSPAPISRDEWQLGTPDVVVKLPRPYTLGADGHDVFRNFVIPLPPSGPRFVRAVEFHPDNPRILHHVALATEPAKTARRLDKDGAGFPTMIEDERKVFGWSPGKAPFMGPADQGWLLEPGHDLVLEMHLLPTGKPETIQPTIGLFFAERRPARIPLLIKLQSKTIDIPPGVSDYRVSDSYTLPADVEVQSVYPHAHNLAREFTSSATLPNGTITPLIWIKAWNFNWQDQYRYTSPFLLPKGTVVTMTVEYDNSAANPHNPHQPPERVANGPLASDEMAVLWIEVIPKNSHESGILNKDAAQRELYASIDGAEAQVRRDPSNAPFRTFLATKYLQAGRTNDALEELSQAVRLDPNDAEAQSDFGTVLQMLGRLDESRAHLREAVRLSPKDARVHFNLGNAMYAGGNMNDAIREYQIAIRLDPEDADCHYNLAGVFAQQKQLDEAIAHLQQAIAIDPLRADAHHNLVLALAAQGRFDEALVDIHQALSVRPDSAQALNDLRLLPRLKESASLRH